MNLIFKNDNKRKEKINWRHATVLIAFALAFIILLLTLFDLQILKGDYYAGSASKTKTRTLTVPGTRGKILDVNGIPLAMDEKIYNVEFYREYNTASERKTYTNSIIKAIEILEANGHSIITTFAIDKNENGEYYLNWGNVSAETAAKRESRWRADFYFKETDTPEYMYKKLREKYVIPEDMPDEEAFKVLSVWQNSIQTYYTSRSIVVAKNISPETVAELESHSYELPGFNIIERSGRLYPQGETAAHIVGYMGRISSNTDPKYVNEYGYNIDDYIGVYGVENIMELYLTGNGSERSGKRVVEVASSGRILKELSYTPPKEGDTVYLTIDINMQKVAEKALADNIAATAAAQLEEYNRKLSTYQQIEQEMGRKIKFASVGAAVVMDVNTGAVLAMASYPSFDPNLFAKGMTQEEYEALIKDERSVLNNKAISSAGTPGSIFKMVTGTAALMEGQLEIDEKIQDLGEYKKYVEPGYKGPMCWYYRDSHRTHGHIDVVEAIKHSCNYFFYECADRVSAEKIKKWADAYGLTSKTNIELSNEIAGQVGTQEILYDTSKPINEQATNMPKIVYNSIRKTILACAERSNKEISDETLNEVIIRMMQMIHLSRSERLVAIRTILVGELGLSKALVDSEVKFHVNDYINDLVWTPTSTITTGIGQGITTLTPIAVARYVSAIVNGGYVYDAHVVQKVVDSNGNTVMETKPTLFNYLNVKEEYLNALKEGMKDVISGDDSSTARTYFADFKYKDQMGGKTGTAQVNNISIENNSWFVAFAPYEKPEIAIVVYIPNGYSGGRSSITIKAIAEYYLDRKYKVYEDKMPNPNNLVN